MAVEFEGALPADTRTHNGPLRWYHKAGALLFVIFCFEIGVFLILFPWTELWSQSYFSGQGAGWYEFWNSPYLRGAMSGLGLINVGIAFSELFRLRRYSKVE